MSSRKEILLEILLYVRTVHLVQSISRPTNEKDTYIYRKRSHMFRCIRTILSFYFYKVINNIKVTNPINSVD